MLSTTQPPLRKGDCLAVEVALQAPNDNGLGGSDAASRSERGHHSGGSQSRQFREQTVEFGIWLIERNAGSSWRPQRLALLIWRIARKESNDAHQSGGTASRCKGLDYAASTICSNEPRSMTWLLIKVASIKRSETWKWRAAAWMSSSPGSSVLMYA